MLRQTDSKREPVPAESEGIDRRMAILAAGSLGIAFAAQAFGQSGEGQAKPQPPVQEASPAATLQERAERSRHLSHPPTENIAALYEIRGNFFSNKLTLDQTGAKLSGSYDDATTVEGTVAGQRPNPVTIVFTRTLADRTLQTYIGAVSTRARGSFKDVQLAGVFYHNGVGPYPWDATGTLSG